MKKFTSFIAVAFAALAIAGASCSGNEKADNTKKAPAKSAKVTENLPNYRYVDLDSVLSKYNLAKDYNEEMIRMQNNMESAAKHHETKIQNFAATMQNKMQNNGYLSEASYRQDEQKIASMQNDAQKSLASMQNNFQAAAVRGQQAVMDSITAFINDYNKNHHYEAIFQKGSTLYINEALDITDEVVEGLNARYNKVNKK